MNLSTSSSLSSASSMTSIDMSFFACIERFLPRRRRVLIEIHALCDRGVPLFAARALTKLAHAPIRADDFAPRSTPTLAILAHAPRLSALTTTTDRTHAFLPFITPSRARAILRPFIRPFQRRSFAVVLLAPLLPPRLSHLSSTLLHPTFHLTVGIIPLPPFLLPFLTLRISRPLIRAPFQVFHPSILVSTIRLPPRLPPRLALRVKARLLKPQLLIPTQITFFPSRLTRPRSPIVVITLRRAPTTLIPALASVHASLARRRRVPSPLRLRRLTHTLRALMRA
mmetsp:Transcript_6688/g.24342  ORF Transcript_6688/g.24342 Transcript_6688/m.24342 type:complete len:283 (+) Transcript_6688:132-980(+)